MEQIVLDNELSDKEVHQLMVEDTSPPYHRDKTIKQVEHNILSDVGADHLK